MAMSVSMADLEEYFAQMGMIPGSWSSRNHGSNMVSTPSEKERAVEEETRKRGLCAVVLSAILGSRFFDLVISGCIIVNMAIVVIETDMTAEEEPVPEWISLTTICLTVVYCVELTIRIYIQRLRFFAEQENLIDFVVVAVDLLILVFQALPEGMPSMSLLRVFRIMRALRILRAVRTLYVFRELYMLLHGFMSAMRAIFWSFILLCLILTSWAVVAVEVIHPLSGDVARTGAYEGCERCPRAFASVGASVITIVQQIVAGDSWGVTSIPIMEKYPSTAIFFYAVILTVGLGALNLILTVIVDRAAQARQEDTRYLLQQRQHEFDKAKKSLLDLCRTLDIDKDGTLTIQEIKLGFTYDEKFKEAMRILNIREDDLDLLFGILDTDGSGEVNYDEFVEQLQRLKSTDTQIMLMFIRSSQQEVKYNVAELKKSIPIMHQELVDSLQAMAERVRVVETTLRGNGCTQAKDTFDESPRELHRRSSSMMNMGTALANMAVMEPESLMKAGSSDRTYVKAQSGDTHQKDLDQLRDRIRDKCVLILRDLDQQGMSLGGAWATQSSARRSVSFGASRSEMQKSTSSSSSLKGKAFPGRSEAPEKATLGSPAVVADGEMVRLPTDMGTYASVTSGRSYWRQTKEEMANKKPTVQQATPVNGCFGNGGQCATLPQLECEISPPDSAADQSEFA